MPDSVTPRDGTHPASVNFSVLFFPSRLPYWGCIDAGFIAVCPCGVLVQPQETPLCIMHCYIGKSLAVVQSLSVSLRLASGVLCGIGLAVLACPAQAVEVVAQNLACGGKS